jgi:hypothetical protein
MADRLRIVRSAGAWVILVYVGLLELFGLPPLLGMLSSLDEGVEIRPDAVPTLWLAALPLVAVAVTGFVKPSSYGARPIALIAFIEYGILLLWSLLVLGATVFNIGFLLARQQPDQVEVLPPAWLITFLGMAAMSVVAGVACWQVYAGLDTLADDIANLQQQIEELDRQGAAEDEELSGGANAAGTAPGERW